MLVRFIGILMVVGGLLVAGTAWMALSYFTLPLHLEQEHILRVDSGDTALTVLGKAEDAGWLRHPERQLLAKAALRLWPQWSQLQRGSYTVYPGDSVQAVAARIIRGETRAFSLTVIEGSRFRELLANVASHPELINDCDSLSEADLMRAIGYDRTAAEGRFLPDTYRLQHGSRCTEVLARLANAMEAALTDAWSGRHTPSPLQSPAELLVLASIIEKETGLASERAQISGVFHRRLERGMRLQTDPTVIYGIGESFDGNLTRRHLQTDTPWNTYTRKGLPPTPIALPGRASLKAAAHPEEGSSLYFVASGNGGHVFSDTLEQHQAAVRKYQLRRKP